MEKIMEMHFCPTKGVIIGLKCGFLGEFAKTTAEGAPP